MSMLPKKYGKSHFHKKENVVYLAQHDCFLNEKELALRPEIAANGRQSPVSVVCYSIIGAAWQRSRRKETELRPEIAANGRRDFTYFRRYPL